MNRSATRKSEVTNLRAEIIKVLAFGQKPNGQRAYPVSKSHHKTTWPYKGDDSQYVRLRSQLPWLPCRPVATKAASFERPCRLLALIQNSAIRHVTALNGSSWPNQYH